jgi:hypothetical protein
MGRVAEGLHMFLVPRRSRAEVGCGCGTTPSVGEGVRSRRTPRDQAAVKVPQGPAVVLIRAPQSISWKSARRRFGRAKDILGMHRAIQRYGQLRSLT